MRFGFLFIPFLLNAGVIKDDFLVNDDDYGNSQHGYHAVAVNKTGSFVVVWMDFRDAAFSGDVWAQRFDSQGNPKGVNFRVNTDSLFNIYNFPSVAVADDGSFFVVWSDRLSGEAASVIGRLYDAQGNPRGGNFDADGMVTDRLFPSVSTNGTTRYILLWERGDDNKICGSTFDITGKALGIEFPVGSGDGQQASSAAAVRQDGGFIATWMSLSGGNYDIYARLCDSAGVPLGEAFLVNPDTAGQQQFPTVAVDALGRFWVAWQDNRSGKYDVYCRRYYASGEPMGSTFKVNDGPGCSSDPRPQIAVASTGFAYVVWRDDRAGEDDVYLQRYDASGNPAGSSYRVTYNVRFQSQSWPKVAVSNSAPENPLVVWMEGDRNLNPDTDIYGQKLFSGVSEPFRVPDDLGSSHQGYFNPAEPGAACVAMNPSGRFAAAWLDSRDGLFVPYFQMFDKTGTPLSPNHEVDDAGDTTTAKSLDLAIDLEGNIIIAYSRGGKVFARRYDQTGQSLGSRIEVSQGITGSHLTPAVEICSFGDFAVAWRTADYSRRDGGDIYMKRFDKNGLPQGTSVRVNTDTLGSYQCYPDLAMDGLGNFVIAWQDSRKYGNTPLKADIYAQHFSSQGMPTGGNLKLTAGESDFFPSVVMDNSGNVTLVWQDWDIHTGQGWCARFTKNGDTLTPPLPVGGVGMGGDWRTSPAIAMAPSGQFVVCYPEDNTSWAMENIMARTYDADGAVDGESKISNPGLFPHNWRKTVARGVAANKDRIAFIWQDNRRHKGWDIYAQITDWNFPPAPGIAEPSPVTPVTHLNWEVVNPIGHEVELEYWDMPAGFHGIIYDISGKKVDECDINLTSSRIRFGKNVPPGVYYIVADGGEPKIHKVVIIR